jgi:hypothetical protein
VSNVERAKSLYEQRLKSDPKDKEALENEALEHFGAAMHAVMDRFSPEHCDFKVYDTSDVFSFGVPGLVYYGLEMAVHARGESGNPTPGQMSVMTTEIRFWFKYAFGEGY